MAFQFQPMAPTAAPAPRAARLAIAANEPLGPAEAAKAANLTPTTAALAGPIAPSPGPARLPKRPVAALVALAPLPLAPETLPMPAPIATPSRLAWASRMVRRPLLRQRATAGPARTTESGLGGIGLFFIAVVLGLLAGLGALVSVIFGTGFFTGVGFAAAGLVVLFLLYSLLSGGKKKSKPVVK